MAGKPTFNVSVTGDVRQGFNPVEVKEKFARLFKLPPEKASSLLARRRVLKKELDGKAAERYRQKLEAIGLVVELERQEPAPGGFGGLALEPIEEPQGEPEPTDEARDSVPVEETACPKCGSRQASDAEKCEVCGFRSGGMRKPAAAAAVAASTGSASSPPDNRSGGRVADTPEKAPPAGEAEGDNVTGKVLAAAAATAFLGALLWKIIIVTVGMELGFLAWVIGGAIGIVASVAGGHGRTSGLLCAALLVATIIGGKFMAVSELKEVMAGRVNSEEARQEWREVYEEALVDASVYRDKVLDQQSLKDFMVERGYTSADNAAGVTEEELYSFQRDFEPNLKWIAYSGDPGFDEWYRVTVTDEVDNVSVAAVVGRSLGLTDLLFLGLGMITAFRLGQGVSFN